MSEIPLTFRCGEGFVPVWGDRTRDMTLVETMTRRFTAPAAGRASDARWRVDVAADVESVSRAWLSLEMSGLSTPYQTLGWQRAALASLNAGETPCIVTIRDLAGETQALIPLVIARRAGMRIAAFPGGKHANYNMGLFTERASAELTAGDMRQVLGRAAKAAGIDLYVFRNQPETWRGLGNPIARLPHQRSASSAWRAELVPDPDAFVASLMSSESRKKLRHKERRLGEIGALSYVEAATPDEARALLDAFLLQKKDRFAALRIRNPFDDPAALAFLDRAAVQPLADGPPAPITLFALKVGERIAAVFGGIVHGGRFSGMFTSFDAAPDLGRHSPGDLLILHLVRTMCARGLTAFDLGVGDAAYKSDYCKVREELFDSVLPMTLKGRVAALAMANGLKLKTAIKDNALIATPLKRLLRR
jgi:CelD/BcsL family acetyltransferase involved in cellulose biosynthesis